MNDILLYAGSAIVMLWGIAHIIPTAAVVRTFGNISAESKQLITMEWIAEGIALLFIGLVVFLATVAGSPGNPVSQLICWAAAAASLAIAILALFTGARTSMIPVKICPAVMTVAALLMVLGNLL